MCATATLVALSAAAPAMATVVPPTGDTVDGCSVNPMVGCLVEVDAAWGFAATEEDPALGVPGTAYAELRWTVPNEGTEPITLGNATWQLGSTSGSCNIMDVSGGFLGNTEVPAGQHAHVVCQPMAWPVEEVLGDPREVTLSVWAGDLDGSTQLTTTAWVDYDLPIAISASDSTITVTDEQCAAGVADGTLSFEVTLTDSPAALARATTSGANVMLWFSDLGGLLVETTPGTFEDSPHIVGSAPTGTFSPDDFTVMLGPDSGIVYYTGDLWPYGSIWMRMTSGFTDVLSFSIPVTFDPEAELGPIELEAAVNMSGGGRLDSLPLTLVNPCLVEDGGPDDGGESSEGGDGDSGDGDSGDTDDSAAAPPASSTPRDLASTGSDAATPLLIAGALLALGALAFALRRALA